MVAAAFDYVKVSRYDQAVEVLTREGEEARAIAGGQSLVPMMNLRLVRPSLLVDLNPIGAEPPRVEGSALRLAALTRHAVLASDPLVARHAPLLAEAVRHVGNVRVRNRGTLGGSLAHGDPTAELCASAVVLDASISAEGPGGTRAIPARELFVSYLTTALAPDEVITEVRVPVAGPGEGWGFSEMVRRTSDLAIVAAAARLTVEGGSGPLRGAELALAGISETVVLVEEEVLGSLAGSLGEPRALEEVAAAVASSVSPESDVHASAGYRRRLVEVLSRRALSAALGRAREAAGER